MASWLCVLCISAQSDTTIYLDEVEILGTPLSKYSAGTSILSVDASQNGTLDGLWNSTAVNFKIYGNGQLSTISLRGTSSSQTSVLWNGLPVNSPTLGQTDFSIWPVFLIDEIGIQKGSASSLFGSGAIGGSIIIDNSYIERDSLATIYLGSGSFGQLDLGGKVQLDVAEKVRSETRFFQSNIKNDFPYELGGVQIRQPNAEVKRLGLSQKFSSQLSNHHLFSEVAFSKNDRQIQPTITSTSRDELLTENFRAVITDEFRLGNNDIYGSFGYTSWLTNFNNGSITRSNSLTGIFSIESTLGKRISTKSGFNYFRTQGRSENYRTVQKEHQYHLFSSWNYVLSSRNRITINLREAFYDAQTVFTPSLGAEWLAIDSRWNFEVRGQISQGFRIPTFNDRFWQPGGNPDLEPEESWNYEVGLDFINDSNPISVGITGYYSLVNNWIQWIPTDGVWTPQNIREVEVKGMELTGEIDISVDRTQLNLKGFYELTLSSDRAAVEGNQLPYVPRHSLSTSISGSKKKSVIQLQANYTSERFTTLSNASQDRIDDFALVDLSLSQGLDLLNTNSQIRLSANNLFDSYYESLANTAMPGRNFLLELSIKY